MDTERRRETNREGCVLARIFINDHQSLHTFTRLQVDGVRNDIFQLHEFHSMRRGPSGASGGLVARTRVWASLSSLNHN